VISPLRQPSGGHIRVRQTGRCLESGLLHPPLAALRRFLPSLRQPSGGHIRVRQTGRCLESGLLHPPLAALRRFPRRPLQKRHPTGWRFLRTPRLVQPSSRQPIPTPIQHFLKPASLFLPQAAVRIVALYNGLPRTAPNLMKICYCK